MVSQPCGLLKVISDMSREREVITVSLLAQCKFLSNHRRTGRSLSVMDDVRRRVN